jgi:hypothetical protein
MRQVTVNREAIGQADSRVNDSQVLSGMLLLRGAVIRLTKILQEILSLFWPRCSDRIALIIRHRCINEIGEPPYTSIQVVSRTQGPPCSAGRPRQFERAETNSRNRTRVSTS